MNNKKYSQAGIVFVIIGAAFLFSFLFSKTASTLRVGIPFLVIGIVFFAYSRKR